jgi:hypothetical protein
MTLSTIYQLYRGGHFIGGGNRSTWGKETNKVCIIKKSNSVAKIVCDCYSNPINHGKC